MSNDDFPDGLSKHPYGLLKQKYTALLESHGELVEISKNCCREMKFLVQGRRTNKDFLEVEGKLIILNEAIQRAEKLVQS